MELTCEDSSALSAPSCRLTRFREFVPNDRMWMYPCFCPELLRPGNSSQMAINRPRGIRHGPRFVRGQTGLTWRNRAKTRPVRNGRSGNSGCTSTDRAFLGTPIAMCLLLKKCVTWFPTRRRARPESSVNFLNAVGDNFTLTAFLAMSRGDQRGFAEAVVSITGRVNSAASNLGFT